ncbi:hypothetical protein CSAL01_12222 [Colletotrichum salicis]|uniref:Uncharacterized protein n=1 Tax=Colletotrichum salicis TaxID=1209931 RepID=A0A135TXG9_9PEZI|nr:hypothetical protein CSAL01_12222 [Colletotrichum salicis]
MDFDEVQEFESFTALLEDDGVKLETMSDFQLEPAQLVNFNADALLTDEMSPGLLTGDSAGSWEDCGVTSSSNAL